MININFICKKFKNLVNEAIDIWIGTQNLKGRIEAEICDYALINHVIKMINKVNKVDKLD